MCINKKTYLIVGASAAGIGAVNKLRQLDKESRIICVSDEKEFPYNKCFLVDYLSHEKTLEQVYTKKQDFFKDNAIELRLNTRIASIDTQKKEAVCSDGTSIAYTKLLLAVGGTLRMPPVPGLHNTQGVFPFYNLKDTQDIQQWITKPTTKKVIIIGAGLSGLECADALIGYDVQITVIDRSAQVLGRQVDVQGAQFIQKKAEINGIQFCFNTTIEKVHVKDNVVAQVECNDGTMLDADMVICALGARPNLELAQDAGLALEQDALVTNEFLQTSDQSIYAAGDCALVTNKLTGNKMRNCTWPDAFVQGMTAGANMIEHTKPYAGVVLVTSSHFFGLPFYVAGTIAAKVESDTVAVEETDNFYKKVVVNNNKVVQGFLLIGHTENLSHLKRSLVTGSSLD